MRACSERSNGVGKGSKYTKTIEKAKNDGKDSALGIQFSANL